MEDETRIRRLCEESVEGCQQPQIHHSQRSDYDSSSSLSFQGFSNWNLNPQETILNWRSEHGDGWQKKKGRE